MPKILMVALVLLPAARPCPVHAQGPWSAVATVGAVAFGDAARITVSNVNEPEAFAASSTTRLTLGVARDFGRFGVRVAYGYLKAGLGSSGDVRVIFVPALTMHEITLQPTWRATGKPGGAMVTLRAGPMVQLWTGDAVENTRTRWGGQGGCTVDAPLLRHLSLLADASLGIAGSFLEEADLDGLNVSYEPTTLWTGELAVGLRYRF